MSKQKITELTEKNVEFYLEDAISLYNKMKNDNDLESPDKFFDI